MRAILGLSLVLLALTLMLDHARELFPRPRTSGALADRALEITAVARGPLLCAPRVDPGLTCSGAVIRIGERTLVSDDDGLLAVFVGADDELVREQHYDVTGSSTAASELVAALDGAAEGELVVLASRGRLAPAELDDVLLRLGARARPGRANPESWALLAVRLERGWVPLAESYARDSGVALAFVVGTDRDAYAGFEGDFAAVRADGRREVFLAHELGQARERSDGVAVAFDRTVAGRPMSAVVAPTRAGADPTRIVWDGVTPDAGSAFLAWVGLADGAPAGPEGVEFEVRVDGERVDARRVTSGTPWKVWLVDLRRFAGKTVALELDVVALGSAGAGAPLWGNPLLVHGYERSPLEVWAEER